MESLSHLTVIVALLKLICFGGWQSWKESSRHIYWSMAENERRAAGRACQGWLLLHRCGRCRALRILSDFTEKLGAWRCTAQRAQ